MMLRTTIHVIDDEPSVRRALARLLRVYGYDVHAYASVDEFLGQVHEGQRACVVVDLRMPGKTGLDLLRELRTRGGELPVILITGHGDQLMAVQAIEAGASDVLSKPFDDKTLLTSIGAALDRRSTAEIPGESRDIVRPPRNPAESDD